MCPPPTQPRHAPPPPPPHPHLLLGASGMRQSRWGSYPAGAPETAPAPPFYTADRATGVTPSDAGGGTLAIDAAQATAGQQGAGYGMFQSKILWVTWSGLQNYSSLEHVAVPEGSILPKVHDWKMQELLIRPAGQCQGRDCPQSLYWTVLYKVWRKKLLVCMVTSQHDQIVPCTASAACLQLQPIDCEQRSQTKRGRCAERWPPRTSYLLSS